VRVTHPTLTFHRVAYPGVPVVRLPRSLFLHPLLCVFFGIFVMRVLECLKKVVLGFHVLLRSDKNKNYIWKM
jgi:hypothetical protein